MPANNQDQFLKALEEAAFDQATRAVVGRAKGIVLLQQRAANFVAAAESRQRPAIIAMANAAAANAGANASAQGKAGTVGGRVMIENAAREQVFNGERARIVAGELAKMRPTPEDKLSLFIEAVTKLETEIAGELAVHASPIRPGDHDSAILIHASRIALMTIEEIETHVRNLVKAERYDDADTFMSAAGPRVAYYRDTPPSGSDADQRRAARLAKWWKEFRATLVPEDTKRRIAFLQLAQDFFKARCGYDYQLMQSAPRREIDAYLASGMDPWFPDPNWPMRGLRASKLATPDNTGERFSAKVGT